MISIYGGINKIKVKKKMLKVCRGEKKNRNNKNKKKNCRECGNRTTCDMNIFFLLPKNTK